MTRQQIHLSKLRREYPHCPTVNSTRGRSIGHQPITEVVRRPDDRPGAQWRPGDAFLAGGTWLFSEEQPELRRLIDLEPLGWNSLVAVDAGLQIGAMCTIHDLYSLTPPSGWLGGSLLAACCEAFLASFKVWNSATVGGNICMSLPAGPMITMTVALEATCYPMTCGSTTVPNVPSTQRIS